MHKRICCNYLVTRKTIHPILKFIPMGDTKPIARNFTGLSSTDCRYSVFSDEHLPSKEPFGLFKVWFEEARERKDIKFPGAFCLATATKNGFPSARFVVLTNYDKDGFKFFSHYDSRKAHEIIENPNVAGSLYWEPIKRSIKVKGLIEKIPLTESEEFFRSRPFDAQIAVTASNQSTPIECKELLSKEVKKLQAKYAEANKVPKPANWGGYVIKPSVVEFWQGHVNQDGLGFDRIIFTKVNCGETPGRKMLIGDEGWVYDRSVKL